MIKKVFWTAIFISMGLIGSLAAFNIADIWGTTKSYIDESFMPFVNGLSDGTALDGENIDLWFSFIGGTIFVAFVIGPVWYLWKGTGIIGKGMWQLIVRIVVIALLFLIPSILGMVNGLWSDLLGDDELRYSSMVFTWIIIAIALIGLWFKS